ncbi:MAG: hypothetical protein ACXWJB_14230 [Limisphaerales bacterium]
MDRVMYDNTHRTAKTTLDVYKDGKLPDKKYKEIGELLMPGHREDELMRQQQLMNEAKRLGGDGLIFMVQPAGMKGGGTIFQVIEYVFKGKVIVYE